MDKINSIRLHRIWICFQGALMGEYLLSVPINATQKTDSKASKVVEVILSTALTKKKKGIKKGLAQTITPVL
ncbi:hypothetical protein QUF76_12275 [Desulfobacterales bacterium HSG16]|nr:hypothetical protein [Desulfobacterales bacterium HSG16]